MSECREDRVIDIFLGIGALLELLPGSKVNRGDYG